MFDYKTPFVVALAAIGALCAGSAQAGGVNWSVSVNLPVVTHGHYRAEPVYYQPAPVYVQPAPVYYQPAPVYYQPRQVVVHRPGHHIVGGRFAAHHHWNHNRHDRHDRREDRRDRREHRDEYGDRRDFNGRH